MFAQAKQAGFSQKHFEQISFSKTLTTTKFALNEQPTATTSFPWENQQRPCDTILAPDKKRFWRGAWELMVAQVVPWSYNYFIRDAEFAHISFESIWHNMQFKNWEWDDNNFTTNQFGHPFQGNLYFSAYRSNGYNFWQSAPASLVGSYMWEVAGETHPAAPNDLVNTTLGGITLGEMTYRVSNLIVNNCHTGFGRQMEEISAFVINPMNGFNRILDGKWGRVMGQSNVRKPTHLAGRVDVGARRYAARAGDVVEKGDNEFYTRAKFEYGDPYSEFEKPFSNFVVMAEVGASDTAYLNTLYVNGTLAGWSLKETEEVTHVTSVTANYDYFHNTAFEYGGQSFHYNLLSDFKTGAKSHLKTNVGAGVVALAAVPDLYLYYGEGRDYDFSSGFCFRGGAEFIWAKKFYAALNYRGNLLATINGNSSDYFLSAALAELSYYVFENVSLNFDFGYFYVYGNYEDFADTKTKYPFVRASVGYRLGTKS